MGIQGVEPPIFDLQVQRLTGTPYFTQVPICRFHINTVLTGSYQSIEKGQLKKVGIQRVEPPIFDLQVQRLIVTPYFTQVATCRLYINTILTGSYLSN